MTKTRLRAEVRHPGPRYREQGACSGEEFRDDVLIPRVREAAASGQALQVELEDSEFGYPIGWLEEVFGGLVRRMPGIMPAQVRPVSTKHPEAAAEAIRFMLEAASGGRSRE